VIKLKFLTFVTFFFFSAVLNAESSVDFKDTVTASPQGQLSLYDLIEPKSYEVVSSIKDKLSQTIIIEIQKSGEHITLSSQSIVEHLKFALTPEEKAARTHREISERTFEERVAAFVWRLQG
jgi:hypothetical protein